MSRNDHYPAAAGGIVYRSRRNARFAVAERRFERRGEFRHFEPLRKRHPNDHLNREEGVMFGSQERKINFGLLIMRVGLAAVLLIHSLPELFGGTHNWRSVGTTLNILNIGVPQTLLGLIILLLEALGAVSLVFGYFFRIACTILFLFFGLNFFYYFSIGYQNLMLWSAGIATVFLGLIYVGPGRYAIAVKLEKK